MVHETPASQREGSWGTPHHEVSGGDFGGDTALLNTPKEDLSADQEKDPALPLLEAAIEVNPGQDAGKPRSTLGRVRVRSFDVWEECHREATVTSHFPPRFMKHESVSTDVCVFVSLTMSGNI